MEKIESNKFEINPGEILAVIDNLKMDGREGYEPFRVGGAEFLLITTDTTSESDNHSKASYARSTLINGYDIYLYEKTTREEKRRLMFHEIAEIIIREQGIDNNDNKAHNLALALEEKSFGPR